ncbi:hypothetical protein TVAG_014320 [Trichomonas vaginalis G3]|uniref:Ankyrin repeat domain-containing protein 54 n=1 Tax=Trichomonas vaginalis (strain ATCC PRA-98 / G3) TaxID=412133 RepID=A2DDI6_TRIV3|nr:ankyrin repeat domain-containing protein 61 family [Trichomonas vaginalis G3]EAY21665.1 hypothetical protein TVAG_014320 [Trichomonas vaginalis G3]KAI5489661.1 ankyrin repeat domain-containing protein 61 family [Trichomonas vaginalis G3]|eukprot:XP_001582651.1 hypothetical protein [Trichomonas vaginalis G3]
MANINDSNTFKVLERILSLQIPEQIEDSVIFDLFEIGKVMESKFLKSLYTKRYNNDGYNLENIFRKIKYCNQNDFDNKILDFICENIDSIDHDKLIDSIVEAGFDFAEKLLNHFKIKNVNSNDLIFSLYNKDPSFIDILSFLNDEYIDVKYVTESIKILSITNDQDIKNNIQSSIISNFKSFQELEKTVKELNLINTSFNAELTKMKNENTKQNEELIILRNENIEQKSEIDRLMKQNSSQIEENRKLISEKSELRSKIDSLEKSNKTNETKIAELNQQNTIINYELPKLKCENEKLKNKNSSQRNELQRLKTENSLKDSRIDELKFENRENQEFIKNIGEYLPRIKKITSMSLNESKFWDVYYIIKEASDQRDLATILYYHKFLASTCETKIKGSVYLTSASSGNIQLTKDFIECGAYKFYTSRKGQLLIHIFIENGYIDAFKDFMKYDYDINQKDNNGNTPLHLAVMKNNYEICQYLCNLRKINKNIRNDDFDTPLDIANRRNYNNIISLLK